MAQSNGFSNTKRILTSIVDLILYHVAIYLSLYIRYEGNIPSYNYSSYANSFFYIMGAFILLNVLFGMYILYNKSVIDFFYLTVIVQFLMTIAIMAVTFFGRWFTFPRSILLISFLISTVVLCIWRVIVFKVYQRVSGTKKVMIMGRKEKCLSAIQNFEHSKNQRHRITHVVLDHYYENIVKHVDEIDTVYIADDIDENEKTDIYQFLIQEGKQIFLNTSFENLILVSPNIMNIEDESIIEVSHFSISPENAAIKRLIDLVASLAIIILTLPIMIVTAVLVKVTSPGPVLYKQVRITHGQREFNILKFRTMSTTAEKETGPVLASSNDARVTSIGKYLRSLRIDELPQLFNVLKGDMSMVGPRPERPFFVEQFKEQNPYYYLRHNVRAGITGYAQVYGKYATDFNSKLNFDLIYIKKYSIILDIKILLQTIKTLFDKVSSKGVEEGADLLSIPESTKVLQ